MGPLLIADNHAAEPERGSSVDVPRSSAPKVSATSRARCAWRRRWLLSTARSLRSTAAACC